MNKRIFWSILIFVGVLSLLSMKHRSNRVTNVESNNKLKNYIDTFKSKEYIQIVKWENGIISDIRVQQISPNRREGVYLMSQDIDFDNRGVLDSLYMFHGRKMVKVNDGYSGHYQSNYAYFDSLGNIQDFRFMKNFEVVYQITK